MLQLCQTWKTRPTGRYIVFPTEGAQRQGPLPEYVTLDVCKSEKWRRAEISNWNRMKGRRERANFMEFMVAFFSLECSPQFKKTAGKWAHTHTPPSRCLECSYSLSRWWDILLTHFSQQKKRQAWENERRRQHEYSIFELRQKNDFTGHCVNVSWTWPVSVCGCCGSPTTD